MRAETIRSSAEISSIFSRGKRASNRFLTLILVENPRKHTDSHISEHGRSGRVAFIAGKKNGNACWRNAAKRRMRELARALHAPWPGYDVLFVAKRPITDATYSKVLDAVENTVEQSDLGKL